MIPVFIVENSTESIGHTNLNTASMVHADVANQKTMFRLFDPVDVFFKFVGQ